MSPIEFSLQVILVSTSGVLSPGPLFFINLLYGSRYGSFVGLKIASGHAIVEFPLVIVLSYGLYTFSSLDVSDAIFKYIGTIGGIFILIFSILQIISILRDKKSNTTESKGITNTKFNIRNPILAGFLFTILNPFFIVWWFTIGSKMISDSLVNFGVVEGTSLVFFSHIWMDYFWLWFTSFMINKGKSVIKEKAYRIFVFAISVILGIYGVYLLFTSLKIPL
ncbi:MAG TPA: LysE family transporter [Nitrososphaeraceae archaeon]|jgi:threonine/homoserine/homoserine lactone efflux protein|nr:LysE family transporter [Nitrososphaeraceae archaeon]